MNILCTDKGYINVDSEVGTKEWEKQMMDSDINEDDMEELEDFVNEINNMN